VLLTVLFSLPVWAAQPAPESSEAAHHGEEGDPFLVWKVLNFAVLAGGLGYLIYKKSGSFFSARTAQIRKGLEESARLKKDAEARYAETERQLSGIGAEIERLRTRARQESEAEAGRLREETARELAKVQAQAAQEIVTAGKVARQELRVYSADLAVSLAERQIRERLTPEADGALLAGMVKDLEGRSAANSPRVS
ncbi:MAG TPA: ATP synthase F0 subunit B, partial [Bryobacteraceae bacterium]